MSNKKIELFCLSTERHCLATLIQYNDLYCEIDLFVKESDFANSFHRALYRIITRLIKENVSTTDIILAAQLNQMGLSKFENDLNSGEYVASICKIPINRASGIDFFKQLLNFRIRRDYENTIQEIREVIHSTTLPTADLIQAIDTIYANKTKDIINLNSSDSPDIMSSLESYIEDLGDNPLDESKILYGPFKSVNNLYGSLHRPGNLTLIGARSGVAKAQPLDCKVLTPTGWIEIGRLRIGDEILNSQGGVSKVLGVFPQGKKRVNRIEFADNSSVNCCDDHLWLTRSNSDDFFSVKSTQNIKKTILLNHQIPTLWYLDSLLNAEVKREAEQYYGLPKYIKKIVELDKEEECVCIKVSADDSLYITEGFNLTHNTSLSLYYNIWMAEKYNMPIVWVDHGEMTVEELQIRAAAIFANGVVPLFAIENGDWRRNPAWVSAIREGLKRAKKIKFFYENVGSKNPNQIISTIRRLKYNKIGRENNFLWVYDYLKPFNSEDGDMPEWKMMGHFIQDIKSFIQTELKTSFFTAIQLNRAGITNNKKAGQVDDSENTITISDRITQQTSHTFLVRRKLNEALAVEGGKFGNLVMIAVKTRHLGKMAERALSPVNVNGDMKSNYINLNMKNFMFEDKGDLVDLLPQLQDKIDVDEDKEKGNIEL